MKRYDSIRRIDDRVFWSRRGSSPQSSFCCIATTASKLI
jgi:hypothetical protein